MADQRDVVDRIVFEWAQVRPDIDVSPIEVIGRISRVSRIIDQRLAENFATHDLESWMYDVMATLRRSGVPYELSAGDLVRQTMVTTGAMTNRVDRLEARGYVERSRSTADRRSVTVRLTAAGLDKVDDVATSHYELEHRLLDGLTESRQLSLRRALRALSICLGDADGSNSNVQVSETS